MGTAKESLVIVESPSKAKTILKFLGNSYKVAASVGHIIDLPKSKFGVDIEKGFEPQYIQIRGKQKIIKQLKAEAQKVSKIYIATDPDREGEAIAHHIFSILDRSKEDVKRIEFNEITKNAINKAIESPSDIDMSKVYSQQARRVLDRIVGYQVSPILWKTVYRGLSAGRVQSVALRLICEREEAIRAFIPEEFWTINILVSTDSKKQFWAKLIKIFNPETKKLDKAIIGTEEEAKKHLQNIKTTDLQIQEVIKRRVKKQAAPPFITSTLQQSASRFYGFTTSRIMRIAQQLYEGVEIKGKGSVGLITYMRTDSTRISNEAIYSVRDIIQESFGKEYLPEKAIYYQSKKSAQDAHEAIRPTYLTHEFHPDALKQYLSSEQFRLYNLIWKRFLACQMNPALYDKTTVDIKGDDYLFRAEGEVLVFEGFLKLYGQDLESLDEDNNGNDKVTIPAGLKEKEPLTLNKIDPKQNFTKPPLRFTESSLVKELDRLGIGRPSTYAQIITTILNRKYVEKEEKKLHASELGETVNKILVQNFPNIFNVKFTAEMEEELDRIASNDIQYKEVLTEFYKPFSQALENVNSQKDKIKSDLQETTETKCDICGKNMVIRWGRNGRFMACSGYPDCKNAKPLAEDQISLDTEEICDKCGNPMIVKVGRYGRFLACSNYPKCSNAKPIPLGIKCPNKDCSGDIIERRSKRGKTFYGCSNYPECKFVSWTRPVNQSCQGCGNNYLVEKYSKVKGKFLQCTECKITEAAN